MKTKEEILKSIRISKPYRTENTLPYSKYMYKLGEDEIVVHWPIGDESLGIIVKLNGKEVKE